MGPMAATGMSDVAARIATIQARIAGLSGHAVGGEPPVLTLPGEPGAGASGGVGAFGLASAATTGGIGVVSGTAATGAGASSGGPGGPGGDLAARLPEHGRPWAAAIETAARSAGIDPALFGAVVQHESNFDPEARSRAGAIGLAQLMPGTAAGLGVDPTDPQANLAGGARYLRQQLDRFGAVELALAAYNAGPNRVVQAGGVPRIPETLTYVDRVMSTWEQLR